MIHARLLHPAHLLRAVRPLHFAHLLRDYRSLQLAQLWHHAPLPRLGALTFALLIPSMLSAQSVPTLDPDVPPLPSPSVQDPYGATLEIDTEQPIAGGPPTQPKNLRVDLIANDWAEINWAPARDDGAVVAYNIYRSDGHLYTITPNQSSTAGGTQAEIDKYWRTTSFIDCNYTRFDLLIHACTINGPQPGDTFRYQVTAIDDEGQESVPSNEISVTYQLESNAPVPLYNDFYKNGDFVHDTDLSRTEYFLDQFDLVFREEFNGPTIDPARWNTALTWGDARIINGEQQYFVDTQDAASAALDYDPFHFYRLDSGEQVLGIEAIITPEDTRAELPAVCRESDPSGLPRCQFLSGALSSHDRFGMTYGYVEGRMRVGGIPGMLSSFYLYHRYPGTGNQRHAPEIDIVEYLGENPFGDEDAFQTHHFADVGTGDMRSSPTMSHAAPDGESYSDGFNTFGVLWEPQLVIWYINGQEVKRMSGPQVARQQMNIVTYLVTGSGWAPTPDLTDPAIYPLTLEIDYIRAWQRPAYNGNGLYPAAYGICPVEPRNNG